MSYEIRIQPRRTGKTTDAVNKLLEGLNNTAFIVPNSNTKRALVHKITRIIVSNTLAFEHLNVKGFIDSIVFTPESFSSWHRGKPLGFSRLIFDEYFSLTDAQCSILYKMKNIHAYESIVCYGTLNGLYSENLIRIVRLMKQNFRSDTWLTYFSAEVRSEIKKRYLNNFITDPDFNVTLLSTYDYDGGAVGIAQYNT